MFRKKINKAREDAILGIAAFAFILILAVASQIGQQLADRK